MVNFQNILIVPTGFHIKDDSIGKERFDQILWFSEFVKMPPLELWKFLRIQRERFFIVGGSAAGKYFYIMMMLSFFANAQKKGFVDEQGEIKYLKWSDFFPIFLRLLIESILAIPFLILTWLFIFALQFIIRVVPRRILKDAGAKKIFFLRTDADTGSRVGGSYSHIAGFTGGLKKLGYEVVFLGDHFPFPESKTYSSPTTIPPYRSRTTESEFFRIPFPTFFHLPELPEFFHNFTFFFLALSILKREKPIAFLRSKNRFSPRWKNSEPKASARNRRFWYRGEERGNRVIAFLYHRNSFGNCVGVMLARALGVPLVYEFNGSEAWARQYWGGGLFLKRLAYFFENICFRGADIIAVVSQAIKDDLAQKGVDSSKIIVNPNGVDPDIFSPAISGSVIRSKYGFEGKIVVGFAGTFWPWHGADILAKAIKPVVGQNSNVRFLFVGEGAMRPKVEEIISSDGVGEFVTMAGAVSHGEMPQYLAACDILVNPTVPNEDGSRFFGSPTKLFEYMAMGKAIVASNIEQIGQVLQHERTAFLVKPGDVDELARAIMQCAADGELRKRFGLAAREEVIKNYTWEMNAKRVVEAYTKLIQSNTVKARNLKANNAKAKS